MIAEWVDALDSHYRCVAEHRPNTRRRSARDSELGVVWGIGYVRMIHDRGCACCNAFK